MSACAELPKPRSMNQIIDERARLLYEADVDLARKTGALRPDESLPAWHKVMPHWQIIWINIARREYGLDPIDPHPQEAA